MTLADDLFQQVRPSSLERSDASPVPPEEDFLGILIAAPAVVSPSQRLMVCGTAVLRYGELGRALHASDAFIVATGVHPHNKRVGAILGRAEASVARPGRSRAKPVTPSAMRVASWFNADLFVSLRVPREPGVWFVHAVIGPYVSNGVRVEISDVAAS